MASTQEIRRLYNALINTGNVKYDVLPDGAAAKTLTAKNVAWTYGTWVEIKDALAANSWLVGIAISNPSDVNADYDIAIGTGAAESEAVIAEVPYYDGLIMLPYAIYIASGARVAGNCRSSSGVADTVACKIIIVTGL